jgi:N-acyl-D-amino-acid deacylase
MGDSLSCIMLRTTLLTAFLFAVLHTSAHSDILITNARILDGTGNSWYWGSVEVNDGIIKAIHKGKVVPSVAVKRTLDAKGLMLTPGFIDVHAHIESSIFDRPTADNYIYDGVTSVVTGNCGNSADDIADFFRRIDSTKTSINIATLAGHNTVRRLGMGLANKPASKEDLQKMLGIMNQAMRDGAVGLSTGLIYLPGMYSNTDEVVFLASIAAQYGGVYATHMRNEGLKVTEAIDEAINIGKKAKLPVQISHFKVSGRANWGRSSTTLNLVKQARLEGHDVTIDQYPYTAASTNLATQVPDWALDGGLDSLRVRIKDKATRERIKREMQDNKEEGKMKNFSFAVVANYSADSTLNGMNISQINKMRGRKANLYNESETILEMLEKSNAQMVFHTMNEDDVKYFMQYPFNMPAADGSVSNGQGMPHPRSYGTNARVLGRYVRELKVIPFEEAIRRMTSLPAQKFNLSNRGLIREGMAADILLIDENKVSDLATFEKPHQFSTGIPYVIVNGQVVVEDGRHTGTRSGQGLRRESPWAKPYTSGN